MVRRYMGREFGQQHWYGEGRRVFENRTRLRIDYQNSIVLAEASFDCGVTIFSHSEDLRVRQDPCSASSRLVTLTQRVPFEPSSLSQLHLRLRSPGLQKTAIAERASH